MSLKKLNQKGFTAIAAMLFVVMIALIGGIGYYVYHTNKDDDTVSNTTKTSKESKKSAVEASPTPANPVLYESSDGTAYEISALATTADQKAQGKAIDQQCKKNSVTNDGTTADHTVVGATGTKELFAGTEEGNRNYKTNGNLAIINTGCYDKTLGGNQFGGGANYYLVKKADTWTFLTASQGQIDCDTVEGAGIKSNLLTTCFTSEGTERAIKP